jgi:predicted RNase H-like nuclease
VGVDVAAGRWVAVRLREGRFAGGDLDADLGALLDRHEDAAVVGIDVPIGLPPLGRTRPCDLAARAALGSRRSSVFPAPAEALLRMASHAAASALSVRETGRGISIQAYGLRAAILEAAPLAAADPRLHEVHPELSFLRAAGGVPLPGSKRSWDGQHARRALLHRIGIELPERAGAGGRRPVDDVLDAAIAAWAADNAARGDGESCPAGAAARDPRRHLDLTVRPGSSARVGDLGVRQDVDERGRPAPRARSSAGRSSSGARTSSPWPPSASTTLS